MNNTDLVDRMLDSVNNAMIVVTARGRDGEPSGCLVGFHGQVSMAPLRWGVWMSKVNHTYPIATEADLLAVHFLTKDQHDIAEHFGGLTGDKVDKFDRVDLDHSINAEIVKHLGSDGPADEGVAPPVLAACPIRLIGRRTEVFAGETDHSCVVLDPVVVQCSTPFTPLRITDVRDIAPGHPVHT